MRTTGSNGDNDRPTPPAGALHYPGILSFTDDELIATIAEPFLLPGEDESVLVSEATAELLRRMDARTHQVA